jgi:hypothetical protein
MVYEPQKKIWRQSTKTNEPLILQSGAKEKKTLETYYHSIVTLLTTKKKN